MRDVATLNQLEENGNKEELIVVLHDNSILLFGERYQGICGLPRIYFEVNTQEIDGLEWRQFDG